MFCRSRFTYPTESCTNMHTPPFQMISYSNWLLACNCQREFAVVVGGRAETKRDGTRAETRICLSAKRTSSIKSAGGSVQSTTGSRGVEETSGYPLHSPLSPSLPLPCVTVCHHVSFLLCIRCSEIHITCGKVEYSLLLSSFGFPLNPLIFWW